MCYAVQQVQVKLRWMIWMISFSGDFDWDRGVQTQNWGAKLLFGQFSPTTAWKLRKLGEEGGGYILHIPRSTAVRRSQIMTFFG